MRRRGRWERLAVALGLGGLVAALLVRPMRAGDTGPLMEGTEALWDCLARLDLIACKQLAPIGPWPLFQYAADLVVQGGGLSEAGRVRGLATLSLLGVAATLWAAWIVLSRVGTPEWRWGFLVITVSGPALAYGNTTWGEMPAAALLTSFVAAALLRAHPLLIGLAAFGASLTKETGYPFVIAMGLIGLLLSRRWSSGSVRRHLAFGAAGVLLAVAANSAFNLLRYGTPRNAYYLDPALRTQSVERFFELAAGLFIAPNGGIAFFWPVATLVFAVLVVVPLTGVTGREHAVHAEAWVAGALVAVVAGLVIGLAAWWAPFGWWAWGPRLSLPWVFPILLLGLAAFGARLTALVAPLLRTNVRLALVAVSIVVVSLPHVGLLWRPETVGEFFFLTHTDVCPGGGPPPTSEYYACLREEMWLRHPIWLDSLAGLVRWEGVITVASTGLVVVGSLLLFRQETSARLEDAPKLDDEPQKSSRIVTLP